MITASPKIFAGNVTSRYTRAQMLSINFTDSIFFRVIDGISCILILSHRTPFNYLLLNLAVADIIYPTFLFMCFIYRHSLVKPDAMPGNAICLSLRRLAWIGADSSVFTLIAIARERYCAVVHPLSIQRKLTWQKLKVR